VLGAEVSPAAAAKIELLAFLEPRLPRWRLPDEIVFIDQIPKTSVGKFSKRDLRRQLASSREDLR
jgi:fatty-acyl-CoA synthase